MQFKSGRMVPLSYFYVLFGFLSLLMMKNTILFPALLDNCAAANLNYFLIFQISLSPVSSSSFSGATSRLLALEGISFPIHYFRNIMYSTIVLCSEIPKTVCTYRYQYPCFFPIKQFLKAVCNCFSYTQLLQIICRILCFPSAYSNVYSIVLFVFLRQVVFFIFLQTKFRFNSWRLICSRMFFC